VLYNALGFAVELELLDSNPIDKVQWKAPEVAVNVDRRVVTNPEQAEALLAGLEGQGERGTGSWRSSAASTTPHCVRQRRSPYGTTTACCRLKVGVGST
jgi:hypothetical protein